MLYFIYIKPEYHFLVLLRPRFTMTLLPPEVVFPKDSTPFEDVIYLVSFSLVDSDLNKFRLVPPKSSFLTGFSARTDSKEVAVKLFLDGMLTLRLEFGRTFKTGKKLSVDFIGSKPFEEFSSEDL